MNRYRSLLFALAPFLILNSRAFAQSPQQIISESGDDVRSATDGFKELLGSDSLELRWDTVPDEFAAPAFLPGDYFNAKDGPRARGAILSTPGQGVQVSADEDNPNGTAPRFGNLNSEYPDIFRTFSPERLFSPIGSNVVDLTFNVPGTDKPAVVRGFGAIYTDVDTQHTAFEYFDKNGNSLGSFAAPTENNGLSFLGVYFDSPVVARVRITYGTVALGPDDSDENDVAVMDNFYYSLPKESE